MVGVSKQPGLHSFGQHPPLLSSSDYNGVPPRVNRNVRDFMYSETAPANLAYTEDRHYPPVCSALTEAAERLDPNVGQVSWLFSLGFGFGFLSFGFGLLSRSASTCLAHLQSFRMGPSIADWPADIYPLGHTILIGCKGDRQ